MCGICGFSPSLGREEDERVIEIMKTFLRHRGPDGEGSYLSERCVLGHRRLSIIDLETGHQPMPNEDKVVWVIFNGEIYNYKDLWRELENRGHRFSSDHSDTEVIVHGYEEWGTEVFGRLNGIFAIAIWDSKKNFLILARDHIGVKPLYYTTCKERFIFASEPKAILCHPEVSAEFNPEQMANYFFFRAPIHPSTMFKGIYKLAPGSFLVWDNSKKACKESTYWLPQAKIDKHMDENEWFQSADELLSDAVKGQLISDVPLGIFLSGGVDSGLLAAKMIQAGANNVDGFVISVGGIQDEGFWSDKVANHLGIANHRLKVKGIDFLDTLKQWTFFNDDPVSDPSALALLLIARYARTSGKIVMLLGEGGDELFGGYNSYLRFVVFDRLKEYPLLLKLIAGLLRISKRANYKESDYLKLGEKTWSFLGTGHNCSFDLLSQILSPELDPIGTVFQVLESYGEKSGQAVDRACLLDQRVRLSDDLLARTDRATMAVGIEARVPLLDYRFIELANSIPQKMKVKRFSLKYVLKKIASNYIPQDVVYRKKIGFYIPVELWLRQDLADALRECVEKRNIPFLNYSVMKTLLMEFFTGKHDEYIDFIWAYLLLEEWYDTWWCKADLPGPRFINNFI